MQDLMPSAQAAIDIGSNTIHVVVARYAAEGLDIVENEEEVVRIGESVTATGEISPEKCDAAITTLQRYKELAQKHRAKPILVVATEAIRQARNNADFVERVRRETGLHVQLISGTAEAVLTFLGATYENMTHDAPSQLGVMDLGGGSMEIVTANGKQITWRTSLPLGSGWLHDRYLPSNPPSSNELTGARTFLKHFLEDAQFLNCPPILIVTGGSANALLQLARRAQGLDQKNNQLTIENLLQCETLLRTRTAEEVSQYYQLSLNRSRILLAGLLIIQAVLEHLHLTNFYVSSHGIREGALLAYKQYGEHWLELVSRDSSAQ